MTSENHKEPTSCFSLDTGWVRIYHDECDCPMRYIIESYDKGYLLLGWFTANYPHDCWLIKTDINGYILWEKVISGGNFVTAAQSICQNNQGEIFISIPTFQLDNYGDPCVLKLNPCGEKVWCKIFHTPDHFDFSQDIIATADGGCTVILGFTLTIDSGRICLAHLDSNGNEQWRHYYESNDPKINNQTDQALTQIHDNGFLISGFCYYEDSINPPWSWLKCYYIKTDSSGNFNWELVADKYYNPAHLGGEAWQSFLNQRGDNYYSSISRYTGGYLSAPAIQKFSVSGQLLGTYELASGYQEGKLFQSAWINDSMLIGSACWFNNNGQYIEFPSKAVKFDTLGHIKQEKILLMSYWLSYVVKTFNGKFLFMTMKDNNPNPNIVHLNTYLFKLTENLAYDSIYTQPFVYDYLCPHPITSDTVFVDNCGVIVAAEEPAPPDGIPALVIHPNPATDRIHIKFPEYTISTKKGKHFNGTFVNYQYQKGASIEVYDMFGRFISRHNLQPLQKEIEINVSNWQTGMYLLRLLVKGETAASGKVLVNLKIW